MTVLNLVIIRLNKEAKQNRKHTKSTLESSKPQKTTTDCRGTRVLTFQEDKEDGAQATKRFSGILSPVWVVVKWISTSGQFTESLLFCSLLYIYVILLLKESPNRKQTNKNSALWQTPFGKEACPPAGICPAGTG